jgi:CheY-like chemotaxis protein
MNPPCARCFAACWINGKWTVEEAANGLVALEKITQCQPTLNHSRSKMPVMDGFQMIAELRKHDDWRKIPWWS